VKNNDEKIIKSIFTFNQAGPLLGHIAVLRTSCT